LKRIENESTVKLSGFNNLTKCLSFNLYDFCAARNDHERDSYVKYISEKFSADKISKILKGVCNIIEANVLAVSDQNYDPWGASSLLLMSDIKGGVGPLGAKAMHLDKSHICAHTYPDFSEGNEICSFRADIDIATCGEISPLKALNYMFECFDADVVVIDYVVRGYTRDEKGRRIYMDHRMQSIQDFIREDVLKNYHCIDLALQSENIWQTKMLRVNQDVQEYFLDPVDASSENIIKHMELMNREMRGVLHMWPE
jgi:S-adenosylmethionine decarboxylase